MATEQDAARERVLAARADLAEELQTLEASGRAAFDIPARIRQSPARAAAIAGAVGFLALKGPQRMFRAARKAIRGEPAPMPSRMLPDEIEKTLRKLGDDGEKVRGRLERDFADYAKKAQKDREGIKSLLLLAVLRPLLARGAKSAGDLLFTPDREGFSARLAEVRSRAGEGVGRAQGRADRGSPGAEGPADETAPTGI